MKERKERKGERERELTGNEGAGGKHKERLDLFSFFFLVVVRLLATRNPIFGLPSSICVFSSVSCLSLTSKNKAADLDKYLFSFVKQQQQQK